MENAFYFHFSKLECEYKFFRYVLNKIESLFKNREWTELSDCFLKRVTLRGAIIHSEHMELVFLFSF